MRPWSRKRRQSQWRAHWCGVKTPAPEQFFSPPLSWTSFKPSSVPDPTELYGETLWEKKDCPKVPPFRLCVERMCYFTFVKSTFSCCVSLKSPLTTGWWEFQSCFSWLTGAHRKWSEARKESALTGSKRYFIFLLMLFVCCHYCWAGIPVNPHILTHMTYSVYSWPDQKKKVFKCLFLNFAFPDIFPFWV